MQALAANCQSLILPGFLHAHLFGHMDSYICVNEALPDKGFIILYSFLPLTAAIWLAILSLAFGVRHLEPAGSDVVGLAWKWVPSLGSL